jgi:hypothetical protein
VVCQSSIGTFLIGIPRKMPFWHDNGIIIGLTNEQYFAGICFFAIRIVIFPLSVVFLIGWDFGEMQINIEICKKRLKYVKFLPII